MKNIDRNFDIVVAGGGLAGVAGAIAAAREGADVLLIERHGFLGGMATEGMVNPFMPYCVWGEDPKFNWNIIVNKGIFGEIIKELKNVKGLHTNNVTFNEELLKLTLDRMILKYGIKLLFHTLLYEADIDCDRIYAVKIANKSGITRINAKYFIDATGDADLSALAGCEYVIGRESDNRTQPMTLCFRIINVDTSVFDMVKDGSFEICSSIINKKYKEHKDKGIIKNPRDTVLSFIHMAEGVIHFNSTRILNKCGIDAEKVTLAEMEGREQMYELYMFLKENIPGFENSQILASAPHIGVRETRRIIGEYTITEEDLLAARKFEDSIARGTYQIDIHSPSGDNSITKHIPYGDYYTIPYRALVPKGVNNLIVAGRPISSTHEAHSAYRVMPISTCIGEGAGIAASIALKSNLPFREVNYKDIQSQLDKYEALY